MPDAPGRRTYDPVEGGTGSDDRGWGSPVPAEYGDLWPQRPAGDQDTDGLDGDAAPPGAKGRKPRRPRDPVQAPVVPVGDPATPASSLPPAPNNGAVGPGPAEVAVAAAAVANGPAGWPNGRVDSPAPVRAPQTAGSAGADPGTYDTGTYDTGTYDTGDLDTGGFDTGSFDTASLEAGAATVANPVYRAVPMVLPPPPGPRRPPEGLNRRQRKAARKAMRTRSRATVRHVDILTVARVSIVFYLVVLAVVVIASVLLWYAANTFGTLPSMEKDVRTLFSLKTFVVHPTQVAEYTSGAGAVLAVFGTLTNIILALVYNLIAEVVGGIRVEVDSYPSE